MALIIKTWSQILAGEGQKIRKAEQPATRVPFASPKDSGVGKILSL